MELQVCEHVDAQQCTLYVFADVHIGSPDCDEAAFLDYVRRVAEDSEARVLILGDLLDYVTKRSKGDVYAQKYTPYQQKKLAVEWLRPIKDKVLAVVSGNHELRSDEDARPLADVADALGAPYHDAEVVLKLPVGRGQNGKPVVYTIYATHGYSTARFIGGKSLSLDRLKDIVLANVYVMAHTHTPHVHTDVYYVPDTRNNTVLEVPRYFVSVGGFQKRGLYPQRKALPSQMLGPPLIVFSGREKKITVEL